MSDTSTQPASLTVAADKQHPCEVKGVKSINSDVATSITFVNKSEKVVKIYWLDYEGKRVLYGTLKNGENLSQNTYLTHPWLITDENDAAWYVYFSDAQPRTIEIVTPEKK